MKKRILMITLAFAVPFALMNCSKDDDTTPTGGSGGGGGGGGGGTKAKSKAEMLMGNTWVQTSKIVGGVEFWPTLDDCEKDNEYNFEPDSILILSEGANVCDPNDPGPFESEWWFKPDSSAIIWIRSEYQIDELTDSTLKISTSAKNKNVYKRK